MPGTDGDGAGILTEVLPLDVIASIFLRLPFKTILTLRCVNKFCRDFTSTPDFVNAHIKLSAQDDNLSSYEFFHISGSFGPTVTRFSTTPSFLNDRLPLMNDCFPWKINSRRHSVTIGSSKDLICTVKYDKFVELWNPTTRVLQHLNPLEYRIPCFDKQGDYVHKFLAFGFGYHHTNDDHKVVALIGYRYEGRRKTLVRVCSLKMNYWRTVDDRTELSSKIFGFAQHSTTPVCGKIHWMGIREVVSFDLGKEVFGMVEPPYFMRDAKRVSLLITWGVLSGCLCLVYPERGDLWVMKEYGVQDSWTIIASNIPRNINTMRPCLSLMPCSVLPNNQILFACQNRFLLYDPKDNSLADPAEKWDACCAYDRERNTRNICLKLNFTCLE